MLELGKPAPDFCLKDQQDRDIKLSDLRGNWVVLYFYPKDDTPGCTAEACEFTESLSDFDELDALVYGVSPDDTESHREFIDKFGLGVGLLSDPDHDVLLRYGAWGEKNLYGNITVGVLRSTTIVDPEGNVAHHFKNVRAKGHAAKVREKVRELAEKAARA